MGQLHPHLMRVNTGLSSAHTVLAIVYLSGPIVFDCGTQHSIQLRYTWSAFCWLWSPTGNKPNTKSTPIKRLQAQVRLYIIIITKPGHIQGLASKAILLSQNDDIDNIQTDFGPLHTGLWKYDESTKRKQLTLTMLPVCITSHLIT